MKNPHRQLTLKSGATTRVAYLPDDPRLKVGNTVTLKDSENPLRWWEITAVSPVVRDKSSIKSKWSNNI